MVHAHPAVAVRNLREVLQEIVHTLLLEEYGVSKKWVIIMNNKRQDRDKIAASAQAETSGSSAQDHYCARGPGEGAKP